MGDSSFLPVTVGVSHRCSPPSRPCLALSELRIQTDILNPFLPDSELVAATGMVTSWRALKCLLEEGRKKNEKAQWQSNKGRN